MYQRVKFFLQSVIIITLNIWPIYTKNTCKEGSILDVFSSQEFVHVHMQVLVPYSNIYFI